MKCSPKPFIKWAGGKGQLLTQIDEKLPAIIKNNEFSYIEPFVGGGAMLFYMLQRYPHIRHVTINDINQHLVIAYRNIKENPDSLIEELSKIENEYKSLSSEESMKDYFLSMRKVFNSRNLTSIEDTALLIFLNRTCFNGLYRENSKGEFNVPFGRNANPQICNSDLIYANSELLNRYDVNILCGDYTQTENYLMDGVNFIYFDPPYRPLSSTSSFNTYVKEPFNDDEQKRLAEYCIRLNQRDNCLWMLSNSDGKSKDENDDFFDKLYADFIIERVWAKRSVNAKADKRGKLTELLIHNYNL